MYTSALSLLALVGVAQSHMSMFYPPPLGGAPSINKQSTELDPEFNYPLGCCGAEGAKASPGQCRGHLDKFDTEEASVTWTSGEDAYFQLTDFSYDPHAPGSTHSGGSCQVGFSLDKGKTWKVAASYHGACPHVGEDGSPEAQTFDFKVPSGMPSGDALFSWVWLNREHEAFENCSKVKIIGSGDSPSPAEPNEPVASPVEPSEPYQSATQPQQPEEDEEPSKPVTTTAPAGGRPGTVVTTTVVVTTVYSPQPTDAPAPEEQSVDNTSDNEWWTQRAHRKVKEGSRRYQIDSSRCECRRDEVTLAARCSCDAPPAKRSDVERKALRMHRRTFYKRVDACDWATAPAMETSYYTSDAKCAPNAKINVPESDTFELKWDVSCGVVEGASEYPLKTMSCGMFGA